MHNIHTYCIRWAFIDLSAGPFSWGPAVGGEGVRTELSLPNVAKTIGAVSGTADTSLINAHSFVCTDVHCAVTAFSSFLNVFIFIFSWVPQL
jgi:hypothetical protein